MNHITRFLCIAAAFGMLSSPTIAQAQSAFDAAASQIITNKTAVTADGIDYANVKVRVRNANRLPVSGLRVRLQSSRGAAEEYDPQEDTTNEYGEAGFFVRSLKNGDAVIMAVIEGYELADKSVTVNFQGGLDIGLAPGSLIKIPSDEDPYTFSDSAVYYFASNGKRYVFPNEKVYFTWYDSFEPVRTISIEDMTKIPIAGNVTYRPGSKLVKFQTDNKVYAVYQNGELRWVKTEDLAKRLYGEAWASKTDDINESFYVNYHFGNPVESVYDFPVDTIFNKYSTIEKDKSITVN